MLKCAIFADFLDLEKVAATLTQLHAREEKHMVFLHFSLKNIHYFIGLNTSLSYIRMVMGEKNLLKCAIFADFLDLKTISATLTQLHASKEKNMGILHFFLRSYITLLV